MWFFWIFIGVVVALILLVVFSTIMAPSSEELERELEENERLLKSSRALLDEVRSGGSPSKAVVKGNNLDVVKFDYLNAKGEYSSRRVKVMMVGQWEFRGVDLDKHQHRSFKFDRVIGSIVSEVTGEVIDTSSWADNLA